MKHVLLALIFVALTALVSASPAAAACVGTLGSTSYYSGAPADQWAVTVKASCAVTATSNASWITVVSVTKTSVTLEGPMACTAIHDTFGWAVIGQFVETPTENTSAGAPE